MGKQEKEGGRIKSKWKKELKEGKKKGEGKKKVKGEKTCNY